MQKNPALGSRSEYDYPSSGKVHGQSFLCISMDGDQFNSIGQQLMYREILVYRKNTPSPFAQSYSMLTDAANQKRIRKAPFSSKLILKSLNNITFTSFAKTDKWQYGTRISIFVFLLDYFNEQCFFEVRSMLTYTRILHINCVITKYYYNI